MKGLFVLMKKSLCTGILILLISCLALYVFAGNYTSPDPTKNNYYDRTKAANFAVNATYSPYTGMTYVIPNDDCTNFVSHCLKAGGMSTISCSNYYDWNGWTYYNAPWENAHYFRYHWGNVNGTGKNRS
jgi:Putative amidase domain